MKKSTFFTLLLALPLLMACSNDEDNTVLNSEETPIQLTYDLGDASTRAWVTFAGKQDTKLIDDEMVYVWGDPTTAGDVWNTVPTWGTGLKAWELKAENTSKGSVSVPNNAGTNYSAASYSLKFTTTPCYYPRLTKHVNLYAIHGNPATAFAEGQAFPSAGFVHTVKTDQREDANFAVSDLIYGAKQDITPSGSYTAIPCYHMLSKIEVCLKAGDGLRDVDFWDTSSGTPVPRARVYINNCKPSVMFTPKKAEDTAPVNVLTYVSTLTSRALMLGEATGTPTKIEMPLKTTTKAKDFGTYNATYKDNIEYHMGWSEAIIPPQNYASTQTFISIEFISGTYQGLVLNYSYNGDFASGYKYRFNITVKPNQLSVAPTVEPWSTDPSKNHTTTITF